MDLKLAKTYKPNPRENANILSLVTFSYTIPTFIQGFKKDLDISDLYQTYSNHKSKTLGDKIEQEWKKELERAAKSKTRPSLKRVLIKTFGLQMMLNGLLCVVMELAVKMMQSLFLGQLISYYAPHENTLTKTQAWGFAGGIVVCTFLQVFMLTAYAFGMAHICMKIRVACCSLIYRKALRLSRTSLEQTTIGQMVNLLSNDVNRFDNLTVSFHYIWVGPLETILATYLMYREMGVSAIIGVAALLLLIPLQIALGKIIAKIRLKTAHATDERVRLMNEVIAGIQVIKMYTWEKPFAKFVSFARRNEIKCIRGSSYIRGIVLSFYLFSTQLSLFLSILSYILLGYEITAKKVFVMNAFYNVLRSPMTNFFPRAIIQLAEANISVDRINKFMLYHEKPSTRTTITTVNEPNENCASIQREKSVYSVSIESGLARWNQASTDNTFESVNIKIKQGDVVAIIGPVGSGKSTLLQVILKELPLLQGTLNVTGRISYAAQEAWLFTGTVRQNITFNEPYEQTRYEEVVNKCSLIRDFGLLPNSDKTVVGERGVSLSGGQRARINLARAVYQDADIYLLDDPLSAVDTHVGRELFDRCIMDYLRGKTVILVTHQLQFIKDADHIVILESGVVKAQGTFQELQRSGLDFAKLLQHEEVQETPKEYSTTACGPSNDNNGAGVKNQNEEQRSKGAITKGIYTSYFAAATSWGFLCVILLLFLLAQSAVSFGDVFLARWVNKEEGSYSNNSKQLSRSIWDVPTNTSIYIYTGIVIATIIFTFSRSLCFFYMCMKSSIKLHDDMLNTLIKATMRFFNTNSSGRILNRFSKDMGAIDELLPLTMMDCYQILLMILGNVVVIATVNPWLLLPTVVIAIIFFFLRIIYLRTSQSVKRLEGVTRSPVFGHLNATLQGLTTIRAFGAESTLTEEFDELQDLHSVTWFLFITTTRAFGYWLDTMCAVYIALVTFSFLILGDKTFGGNVGLAITQSMGLSTMFQLGIRQSAEIENQMTSVERVLEYNEIEHERPLQSRPDKKPSASWPQKCEIKFEDLHLYYFPDDPPVLKNVSFTIKPLQKIGIVGRTGAGKSSLINALFQLSETHGSITIDDINIKDIGLHDLRAKISIIPQEPILFSGTMRKNLDPFDEYSDDALWKSLDAVELKNVVKELNLGLNSAVSQSGSNFSVGQRQLICLARAILRKNKILILDEATANVDPQTDVLIQTTIRKEFAHCTVLTVAHRLNTIMDSDKVLVMDGGTVSEFDHPFRLLQNTDGIFYGMVQEMGASMVDSLTNVAKESSEKLQDSSQENPMR